MKRFFQNKYSAVIILFVCISAVILILKSFLQLHGFDTRFLLVANLLLFLITIFGFLIQMRGLKSANTNVFIRGVYSSFLLKLFVIMIAVVIYLFIMKSRLNKPSLFTSMGIYILYAVVEVFQLMKIARGKINA